MLAVRTKTKSRLIYCFLVSLSSFFSINLSFLLSMWKYILKPLFCFVLCCFVLCLKKYESTCKKAVFMCVVVFFVLLCLYTVASLYIYRSSEKMKPPPPFVSLYLISLHRRRTLLHFSRLLTYLSCLFFSHVFNHIKKRKHYKKSAYKKPMQKYVFYLFF